MECGTKALQIWDQVPGLPDSKVWHFHRLAFMEVFRRCPWLNKDAREKKDYYSDQEKRG